MLRVLPVLIAIVLAVFCLVDVVMRSSDDVRYLPRWAWAVIILIVPIVGPVGYLLVGREQRAQAVGPAPSGFGPRRPIAPDDDPEFLNQIRLRRQREQEERLRRWQEELEERERELQQQQQQSDDDEGKGNGAGPSTT